RGIGVVFAVLGLIVLLSELRSVVVQLMLAVLLAAAANPMVEALTTSRRTLAWRWRPGRGIAALTVFLAALLLLVLGVMIILATVAPDVSSLASTGPDYVARGEIMLQNL